MKPPDHNLQRWHIDEEGRWWKFVEGKWIPGMVLCKPQDSLRDTPMTETINNLENKELLDMDALYDAFEELGIKSIKDEYRGAQLVGLYELAKRKRNG